MATPSTRTGLLTASLALAGSGLLLGTLSRPTPVAASADRKAAGAELFATRGCAHCHGDNGQGTERGPNLHDLRKKLSEDKIHDQIVHGGQGMPAFGDSLTPDETGSLVAFLHAKKWITPPAQPGSTPRPSPAVPSTPAPTS